MLSDKFIWEDGDIEMSYNNIIQALKGGKGSGNFGHGGRKGVRGGSAPGGGRGTHAPTDVAKNANDAQNMVNKLIGGLGSYGRLRISDVPGNVMQDVGRALKMAGYRKTVNKSDYNVWSPGGVESRGMDYDRHLIKLKFFKNFNVTDITFDDGY